MPFKPSINLPFLLILSLSFDNVLAEGDRLDTPDNIHNFRLVVGFSMALIMLGCLGCIYVFYRVYKQWILNKKRLVMIYKLPFYTAVIGKRLLLLSCIINYVNVESFLFSFLKIRPFNKC